MMSVPPGIRQTRLCNRRRSDLGAVFPAALTVAGDGLGAPTVLRMLERYPSDELLRRASRDELIAYWSKLTATGWTAQQPVPSVGTSNSPTLVVFQDKLYMFWRGIDDDHQAYFSRLDGAPGAGWGPQKVVQYPDAKATEAGDLVVRLVSIGTTTHMAWKGLEGDSVIYWSTL